MAVNGFPLCLPNMTAARCPIWIVEKNFFEWYNLRIEKAYKHIFVRDVFKQWYLSGINQSIDSPERLIEFLKNETDGTIQNGRSE